MNPIPFSNQYVTLGKTFYVKTNPVPVESPSLIKFNEGLAHSLGFDDDLFNTSDATAFFSGNRIPEGAEPLAMAYAGHQFGHFNPQLGDGRAILLGELVNADGESLGLQLKGSGQTFYSRNGDGRAALGPVLREYLVSEAMEKLGVPTTRALAVVATGEEVERERLLPGGIITRIAKSFVRVGTFQYFSSKGDREAFQKLADHVIAHNYPTVREAKNPYVAFLEAVVERQAALIAQWMQLGFIHGVMNTDNMSIAGETIDYGPCAFMDAYHHERVFSFIDRDGRYAYNNQPAIGLWNLTRLAETLLPLFSENTDAAVEIAQDVLQGFIESYERHWLAGMRAKCGLTDTVNESIASNDKVLIEELFNIMALNKADFTQTFYYLSRLPSKTSADKLDNDSDIRNLFENPEDFDQWAIKWRDRLLTETQNDEERQTVMQSVNPIYIPRNHQIEAAIRAAEDRNDFSVFHELHDVLQQPFVQQAGNENYQLPPEADQEVKHTFCGT